MSSRQLFVKRSLIVLGALVAFLGGLAACRGTSDMPKQELASFVDLERFMGTWYVLAHKPTFLDGEAYAATETYELDGEKIRTTYAFRDGSFEGEKKEYHPVGTVYDEESNAEWRMRFFWLFKQPYLILYVDEDYETTVIGYPDRSMAWIMARTPEIPEARYEKLTTELTSRGYDLSILRRMPQRSE